MVVHNRSTVNILAKNRYLRNIWKYHYFFPIALERNNEITIGRDGCSVLTSVPYLLDDSYSFDTH